MTDKNVLKNSKHSENNYQIESSSKAQIINRVNQPKPSIAISFENFNLESADENRQPNVDDGFLDNEFRSSTSTQNATSGSPLKKRNKKVDYKETEESFSVKSDNGNISFSFKNCNTLRLIYTIIITNQDKRELLFGL